MGGKNKKPSEGLNMVRINELLNFKELKESNEELPDLTNEETFLQNYIENIEPEREERKQKEQEMVDRKQKHQEEI